MGKVNRNFALMLTTRVERHSWEDEDRWIGQAELVTIEGNSPRNITSGSTIDGTLGYEGWFVDANRPASWDSSYWNVRCKAILNFELREMVANGKVAAHVDRAMRKLDDRFGRPTTFGQFVLRFAEALGFVEHFVVLREAMTDGTYSSGSWDFLSPASAAEWLDSREREFAAKHVPVTA